MERKLGITFTPLTDARLERIRAAAPGFEIICCNRHNEDLAGCEVVFGHIAPPVLSAAKNLKWLHTQSAGVDMYMTQEAGLPDDVMLTNSSGAYGIGISEHLLAVTLMLLRNMGGYVRLQSAAKWEDLGNLQTLYGKLVTVVGLGDIGGNYASRCRAMGARVRGVVRTARPDVPSCADELFTVDQLDEAVRDADIVALCLPGTSETARLFNKDRLLKLKPGSLLLNIGRGSAIDQDALIDCLSSGHLGGAGLDVTAPEPLPAESPLWAMPNVIITPHISGGASLEITLDLIVDKFAEYLQDYAAGKPFKRSVDRQAGY
ncbi:MAG: D-2-hydroxyacid dehydrogenase [Defluviitaleaceae bacterium]|nr:D-2-hydroxyacid dehydrogenase [Defluviitaleaceae bacterium]